MLDTGASDTIISPTVIRKIPGPLQIQAAPPVFDYTGRQSDTRGKVLLSISFPEGTATDVEAIIVDHAQKADLLLGSDFFQARCLQRHAEDNTVQFTEPLPNAPDRLATYKFSYWLRGGLARVCTVTSLGSTTTEAEFDDAALLRHTIHESTPADGIASNRPAEFTPEELTKLHISSS